MRFGDLKQQHLSAYVTPRVRTITPSGSRTRDAGAGGGRSTKEAKGYSR